MTFLELITLLNNGLVLIYGLFLSVFIAGGWQTPRQHRLILLLCPVLILIQFFCWSVFGEDTVRKLYPLHTHLPLILFLIFGLKKTAGIAVVSVLTAYLCCQLPRWCNIFAAELTGSPLIGQMAYTLCIGPVFFLLRRFFAGPAFESIAHSRKSLLLFGSLPTIYYLFDYATTVYSDFLYAGIPALSELISTALILFYTVFLTVYHHESQKRMQAELETSAQIILLSQMQKEMDSLRKIQTQTALYRHDMRHHLAMLEGFLTAGKTDQAIDYIEKAQQDITAVSLQPFCGNDTVNLIFSSFAEKARKQEVRMTVRAHLPQDLSIPDAELCAILSNALENALNAAANIPSGDRWVEVYCDTKRDKLLIEIRNSYCGTVTLKDGIPFTDRLGHGFGCSSIRAIVAKHRGLYVFEPGDRVFTLQIMLPLSVPI